MSRFDGTRPVKPRDTRVFTRRFWVTALVLELGLAGAYIAAAYSAGWSGAHALGVGLVALGASCWALAAAILVVIRRSREPISLSPGSEFGYAATGGRFLWLDDGLAPPFLVRSCLLLFIDGVPLVAAGALLALM